MNDLKPIIAKNVIDLRKSMNWTQAELAQKLNYSDKAVSKWERAESVPDIAVLKEIAGLFDVSMDYLLEVDHTKGEASFQSVSKHKRRNRLIITLLSTSLVFLIATLIFVFWELSSLKLSQPSWIAYVYSLPIAFTVLLVFNTIWGKWKTNFAIISSLVWSILLAVYLSFPSQNKGLIFIIGIPTQIIILLWANYKLKGK